MSDKIWAHEQITIAVYLNAGIAKVESQLARYHDIELRAKSAQNCNICLHQADARLFLEGDPGIKLSQLTNYPGIKLPLITTCLGIKLPQLYLACMVLNFFRKPFSLVLNFLTDTYMYTYLPRVKLKVWVSDKNRAYPKW